MPVSAAKRQAVRGGWNLFIYIHTYMHTYIHTYCTDVVYSLKNMRKIIDRNEGVFAAKRRASGEGGIHLRTHTYIHTYTHTCIRTTFCSQA